MSATSRLQDADSLQDCSSQCLQVRCELRGAWLWYLPRSGKHSMGVQVVALDGMENWLGELENGEEPEQDKIGQDCK